MDTEQKHGQSQRSLVVAGLIAVAVSGFTWLFFGGDASVEKAPAAVETARLPSVVATDIHPGLGYALATVAAEKLAPPVFVDAITVDLDQIPDVDEKKTTFFRILLPLIARENDRVRAERQQILDDPAAVGTDLYDKYDVDPGDVDTLLRRVDVVPASLVLAQAVLESGWGTSRFAREGNNLFGIRTYDEDTPGLEPEKAEGFKVRAFKTIGRSVRAYIININTHNAYRGLRDARAAMRDAGKPPSGPALTHHLKAYSEIPGEYGERLRTLIAANDLARFDGVRLAVR